MFERSHKGRITNNMDLQNQGKYDYIFSGNSFYLFLELHEYMNLFFIFFLIFLDDALDKFLSNDVNKPESKKDVQQADQTDYRPMDEG